MPLHHLSWNSIEGLFQIYKTQARFSILLQVFFLQPFHDKQGIYRKTVASTVPLPGTKPNCTSFSSNIKQMLFSRTLSTTFVPCSVSFTILGDPHFLYKLAPHLFSNHSAYLFHLTYFDKVSSSPPLQLDYQHFKIYFKNSISLPCFHRLNNIYDFCIRDFLHWSIHHVSIGHLIPIIFLTRDFLHMFFPNRFSIHY